MQTISNVPLGTAPQPPPAMPAQGQKTKSGCGCCGCLMGCFALVLIPVVILVVLYFTVDVGKVGDQAVQWGYHQVIRPQILEESFKNLPPEQKKMSLDIFDHYMNAYMALPDSERKLVRQEALTFVYYNSQNQQVPPEKIVHLNRFIQNQMEILKKKYPELPPDLLKEFPPSQKSM